MSEASSWTPKPWLAALLSLFLPSAGFLYGATLKWASIYFFSLICIAVLSLFVIHNSNAWTYFSYGIAVVSALHAYQYTKRRQADAKRPWYSRLPFIIAAYILLAAVLVMMRAFFYETFRLPASSMAPTITRGTNILVKKWGYGNYQAHGIEIMRTPISATLKRGDIIVFSYPPDPKITYIKRLIGLPGDLVSYKDKVL